MNTRVFYPPHVALMPGADFEWVWGEGVQFRISGSRSGGLESGLLGVGFKEEVGSGFRDFICSGPCQPRPPVQTGRSWDGTSRLRGAHNDFLN